VDLLFHMLIPTMLALIAELDRKKAFMLAPIAIIPDLDIFFSAHRVYLHTILIPLAISIPLLYYLKKGNQRSQILLPTSLYYLSHLLLDFFSGPVAVFWPLTYMGYGLKTSVIVNQQSLIPTTQPHIEVVAKQIQIPNVVTNVAAATSESIITAVLLLAIMFMTHYKGKRSGN